MATAASSFLTDVRLELGSPPTTRITDAQILTRINRSYMEVATRYRHPELNSSVTGTTVSGTATVALSTATRYWYTVALRDESNDTTLVRRPMAWLLSQDRDSHGAPQYYTRYGTNMILHPIPDGAYSYAWYYQVRPALLTSAPDTSTVFDSTDWDEIVMWGGVWRCFQTLGQQDRMIHTRNVWRTLINSMPEAQVLESENQYMSIQPLGLSGSPSPGSYQSVG